MPLDPRAAQALDAHRELLGKWRKAMDLIGPGPMEPHFEDALGATEGLDATGDWADLGSGAGFPGIALAARYPDARVQLVESRDKRARFLTKVVRAARLDNASVHRMRTEDLVAGSLDGLISRAYKPPVRVLIEDAARLLRPGGTVALLLGDGRDIDAPAGFSNPRLSRYPVGDGHRHRLILTWEG